MTRLNAPPRFGRRILPLIVAAPLMMSACAPQPTYTLYDVQPGRGWPNSGSVNYPPPLPPTPPAPPIAQPAPQPDPDISDQPQPPRRHQQPPVIAQPDDPPVAELPPRPSPPPSGDQPECVGWWRICHFFF